MRNPSLFLLPTWRSSICSRRTPRRRSKRSASGLNTKRRVARSFSIKRVNMVLAGIKVTDTHLVRDAMDLARSSSELYLFNHVMRSWLFSVLLSEDVKPSPDPELLAVSTVLHDLGLTDRYMAEERFEVDGANAARAFLKGRGLATLQLQLVWDAIALHTTRSIALHKEPEVVMTHSGITADVLGAGLDKIPQAKQGAILAEFPRLAFKNGLKECLCNIARRKPESTFDNIVRDFGVRYVEGYTPPNFADVVANSPFSE